MNECHNCKKSMFCQLKNEDKKCKEYEACIRVKQVSMFKEFQYK